MDAEVMGRFLPSPFRPKLHRGNAIAGICLIRLEQVRPAWLPRLCGISSENAAHRIAVQWETRTGETREGVYIPRRDTDSRLNHFTGGRIFPGEHHLAEFAVTDDGSQISMSIRARDHGMTAEIRAHETDSFPASSCFDSLAASSEFFEGGSVGYSATRAGCRLDGLRLEIDDWNVRPLAIDHIATSFFADEPVFPSGSVTFDHALIMREIEHVWHEEPEIFVK